MPVPGYWFMLSHIIIQSTIYVYYYLFGTIRQCINSTCLLFTMMMMIQLRVLLEHHGGRRKWRTKTTTTTVPPGEES